MARLAPPSRIRCVYTDVEPERSLREVVSGDLTGVLETLFREGSRTGVTRLTFNWYVRVTNPALNLLGYVAERPYRRAATTALWQKVSVGCATTVSDGVRITKANNLFFVLVQ